MNPVGGYQMVVFDNVTINPDSAVTITDAKNAEILRTTNKPVFVTGIKVGATAVDAVVDVRTNTGARDGKVYGITGPNATFYNISTDDDRVTFTPS